MINIHRALICKLSHYSAELYWYAIDLIIMQIIFVPDSLEPLTHFLFLTDRLPGNYLAAILQYCGRPQFLNFYFLNIN
jgi:hypothetical protein